jgi:superfamily II DNA/RNA helicase
LQDVTTVVIDEADQMADMGFLPQVHAVMRKVEGDHQTMLFSATLDGAVGALVRSYMDEPVRYEADTDVEVSDTQEHRFLQVHYMDKAKVVAEIAAHLRRSLVFVGTKRNADRVADDLRREGVRVAAIHGDRRQRDRENALARFAAGDLPVLVATNVAARGLHIDDVDVVIHYDPPQDYKSFIHRSGRTARAGESGLVVTLVEWDQVTEVQRLQRASGLHQEIVKMYSNDPRLADLASFRPETVEFKRVSDADLSRRSGRRRRR